MHYSAGYKFINLLSARAGDRLIMRRFSLDDLSMGDEVTQNADYLSSKWKIEDIWATKKYIHRRRAKLQNYRRLENALWRVWTKQEQRLRCSSTRTIQWYGVSSGALDSLINPKLTSFLSLGTKTVI